MKWILQHVWRACSQPSLMRRLLLAQMLLLILLWVAAFVFLIWVTSQDQSELNNDTRYDLVLSIVDTLADQPEKLRESLQRLGTYFASDGGQPNNPLWRTNLVVWRGDELLYMTPGFPSPVKTRQLDQVERIAIDGLVWRARTRQSPRSPIRVTVVQIGDYAAGSLSLASRGLWVVPLLVSLPFLFLPTWLSLRIALRPLRHMGKHIAERDPFDHSPLQNTPPQQELRPLVDELNGLLWRAHSAIIRERTFLADAAHELRTPVAALRINAEALQRHVTHGTGQELLAGIISATERSGRLVNQLLTLAHSAASDTQSSFDQIAVDALLQNRIEALAPLAKERRVQLRFKRLSNTALKANREGLASLIDNLLGNAIKYSPIAGTVVIDTQLIGQRWVLTVDDEGPGIDPVFHARVFDRFYRVPDQQQPGSGLGLAIVRAVLERHAGEVTLGIPPNGHGLRVVVALPGTLPASNHDE